MGNCDEVTNVLSILGLLRRTRGAQCLHKASLFEGVGALR